MSRIRLEVCVDDAAGIAAAAEGGADRIELCAALGLGGLTPSVGLMALAAQAGLPAMAMIRPRAGDFVWSKGEVEAMKVEIDAVRAAGLAGVVIGASRPDGRLDGAQLAELVKAAEGLDITLHRAIDLAPDPVEAMELLRDLGIRRVLSSGGARSAAEGIERLAAMAEAAPEIVVMPGGGVSEANAALFASRLPLAEIHASCSVSSPLPELPQVSDFGFQPAGARATDAARVRALRAALDQITASRPEG
ncbi:copper homeostasis protein CutC [Paracoccus zhejiangensis]|uniref:PF03932 family protein CutC n=1 Tax=Paracoccus zhejiangensis TaxID=1077935 RepID=A0A2H5EY97_9RHOB|nr:copper homeostasis protein CutC [Paracoccus zhejiangensis]AUH64243.1 copper homeostasis protein CutC [Paracoccus zhejiangensis]